MVQTVKYPVDYLTICDFKTHSYRLPLPIKRQCSGLCPPFVASPEQIFNCNRCNGEPLFYTPFVRGDIYPIQFNFEDNYNDDPLIPVYGWKTTASVEHLIEICILDCDCNVIYDKADQIASSFYVGYSENCNKYVQTIFIDTNLLPLGESCFQMQVTVYQKQGGATEIYAQWTSEKFAEIVCNNSVEITSTYVKNDCCGHCYDDEIDNTVGTTNEAFYNFLRVDGDFNPIAFTKDLTEDENGSVTNKILTNRYQLGTPLMPPYYAKWLDTVLNGDLVKINGFEIDRVGDIIRDNEENRMFTGFVEIETDCEISSFDCDE